MEEVDRHHRRNGKRGVVSRRDDAGAEDDAYLRRHVVFDGLREAVGPARSAVEPDVAAVLCASYNRIPAVLVDAVESQYPLSCHAVFPGRVDEQVPSGLGSSVETVCRPVDANILHVGGSRKRVRDIEPHAQDPSVRQPEERLRIDCQGGGVGAGAETIAGTSAKLVIFAGGEGLLDLYGGRRYPPVLAKSGESVLRQQA